MRTLSRNLIWRTVLVLLATSLLFLSSIALLPGVVDAAADTDPLGSGGLGVDLNKEEHTDNFKPIVASDFRFTFIDRNNILLEPTDRTKVFYEAATGFQITMGDYFPAQGVVITDGDTDDVLNFENEAFGLYIDYFDDAGRLTDSMNQVEDHLGPVNVGDINDFEFTWTIREDDRNLGLDSFFVLDDSGWHASTSSPYSGKGLEITNPANKQNFNISLQTIQLDEATVVLESTEAGEKKKTFEQCSQAGATTLVFSQLCAGGASITLANTTVEQLIANSTTINGTYSINGATLPIYGGSNAALQDSVNNALEGAEAQGGESCESEGGEFSFIVCPALFLLNDAFSTLDGWVIGALDVNEAYFNDTSVNGGVRRVWQSIRNIAYIILIPIMLVMVIATALNSSAIDAYTVRRALPRLFAAIVFMALSYDICLLLIDMSNVVGRGTAGLVANPFGGLEMLQLTDIFVPSGSDDLLAVSGVIAIGIATLFGAFSFLILLSFLATAVGTLFVVFFILTLREMLIIFLVVMAPLAILSWIFKGNDALWKLWWGTFWKLLVLFPVVAAFLVLGRGFASVLDAAENSAGTQEFYVLLVKLVAFVGPYFAIPTAFRFVGGAFANLAGSVNDRSKGFFDRNKNFRANQRKKNYERAAHGARFKQTPGLRRLNETVEKGFAAKEAGVVETLRPGGLAAAHETMVNTHAQQFLEDPGVMAAFSNDNIAYAANLWSTTGMDLGEALVAAGAAEAGDTNRINAYSGQIRQIRERTSKEVFDAVSAIKTVEGGTAIKTQFEQGTFTGNNKPFAVAGEPGKFKDEDGRYVDETGVLLDEHGSKVVLRSAADKTSEMIGRSTHGGTSLEGFVTAKSRGAGQNAGRMDQAMMSFGTQLTANSMSRDLDKLRASGASADVIRAAEEKINDLVMDSVVDSIPAGHELHGKPESVLNIQRHRLKRLVKITESIESGTPVDIGGKPTQFTTEDLTRELVAIKARIGAAGSAAPQLAKAMQEQLTGVELTVPMEYAKQYRSPNTPPPIPGKEIKSTVAGLLGQEAFLNDPVVLQMSQDFQAEQSRGMSQAATRAQIADVAQKQRELFLQQQRNGPTAPGGPTFPGQF